MFEALRGFLGGLLAPERMFDADDHRLAATALLIHVADADGELEAEERERLRQLIGLRFGLEPGEAAQLIREALENEHASAGVDDFANILRRALDSDGCLKVVEMMWDIVYADGEASEMEESAVWRIAGMLGVSEADMETLRRARRPGAWPETAT